mmetsp:Transcript_14297/g.30958  ORF Transcript_14297/g.30958 Transcript_14297/m.30958 type:complete len:279 (-) Transcript_14297:46-882(-)
MTWAPARVEPSGSEERGVVPPAAPGWLEAAGLTATVVADDAGTGAALSAGSGATCPLLRPCRRLRRRASSVVCSAPTSGHSAMRQMGHVLCRVIHWSTHVWWKTCMQGSRRSTSSSSYSQRHTAHWGVSGSPSSTFLPGSPSPPASLTSSRSGLPAESPTEAGARTGGCGARVICPSSPALDLGVVPSVTIAVSGSSGLEAIAPFAVPPVAPPFTSFFHLLPTRHPSSYLNTGKVATMSGGTPANAGACSWFMLPPSRPVEFSNAARRSIWAFWRRIR